jgi:hypothetical protein
LHGFFNWRIGVETVALEDIHIIQLKTLQRALDSFENVLYMRFEFALIVLRGI